MVTFNFNSCKSTKQTMISYSYILDKKNAMIYLISMLNMHTLPERFFRLELERINNEKEEELAEVHKR